MAGGAAAGAAAAAAAIAQAIKASGAIVKVEPNDFISILSRANKPLVVVAKGGLVKSNYQYLMAYKGLIFFTKAENELSLPGDIEVVAAKKIWVPD
jgi:ABC-type transport system substrate-binding protein